MEDSEQQHWSKSFHLMVRTLVIWFVAGYVVHAFAIPLNSIVIFGFPLGFYMAAQGSLIIFVVLIFFFSAEQEAIDRDHGCAEDL